MKRISRPGLQLKNLLFAVFIVPVQQTEGWKVLSFKKIPANNVTHSQEGMKVKVAKSASPIIYRFDKPKKIKAIKIKGSISGRLNLKGQQGEKGFDDSILRLGLVIPGSKKLNFFQKQIAPKWVLELHDLAPKGTGVDHIEFFCVANDEKLVGKSRKHPLSELLIENFVWKASATSQFEYNYELKKPLETLALWLAIDGDDTGSEFELQLSDIQFEVAD